MARINSNIDPKQLHRLHLIAEYREITMVPAALRRSLRTKDIGVILRSIPRKFTLNSGHVKFFYDKMVFLQGRFDTLVKEMEFRGYTTDISRKEAFNGLPHEFYNNWESSRDDDAIVLDRIRLRKEQKPHLYSK